MSRRIASLICLSALLLTACSHAQQTATDRTSASPAPALFYPTGIVPPGNWSQEVADGVYSADTQQQCCFLAGKSEFTLDNPPGARLAVFKFYVPSVKPFAKTPERVSAAFNGIPTGTPAELATGMHDVIFTIPASLRGKARLTASLAMSVKWIPKQIGLNADTRELSIILLQVGYI
jgi:hypothetical protein